MKAQKQPISYLSQRSEVALAMEAALRVEKEGKGVRVVSMPCAERFDKQSEEYRESVLPKSITKRIAIEAGIKDYWYKYVGLDGKIIAMTSFGDSAPADILFKHFGITSEAAYQAAVELVK